MISLTRIKELCERWARWRAGGSGYHRQSSMTGNIVAGMKSTRCPNCHGEGKIKIKITTEGETSVSLIVCGQCGGSGHIKGDLEAARRTITRQCVYCRDDHGHSSGEINGRTCPHCRGLGKKIYIFEKVNPASIRPTGNASLMFNDDPISEQIDSAVSSWAAKRATRVFATVLLAEHCANGRQQDKAAKLKISQGWYSKLLAQAYQLLAQRLEMHT